METVIHTHQDGCILHHSGLPEKKTSHRSKLLGLEVRPDVKMHTIFLTAPQNSQ